MIGVITASKTSGSVLGYDFGDKKEKDQKIHILASEGVFMDPELVERLNQNWTDGASKKEFKYVSRAVADDLSKQFDSQASLSDRIVKTTGHIALSFPEGDRERLQDDDFAIQIATEYMEEMGINDTQWVLTAHLPTPEQPDLKPHIHLAYNRVRYDGSVIDSKNERYRSQKIAAELSEKYGLTPAGESPRLEQSLSPVQQQFEQMRLMAREALKQSCTMEEFKMQLRERGIELRESEHSEQQKTFGLSYSMIDNQEISAKGSKLDRSALSYAKVTATLEKNLATRTAMEQKAAQDAAREEFQVLRAAYSEMVPTIQKLHASVNSAYQLYTDTKKAGVSINSETNQRYSELKQSWDEFRNLNAERSKAKTAKDLAKAIGGMMILLNPIAGLMVLAVGSIAANIRISNIDAEKKVLLSKIEELKTDIDALKQQKSDIKIEKQERLKDYLQAKDARNDFRQGMEKIKEERDTIKMQLQIQELKRKYPFKEPGHIMYIVHSNTDASIFHAGEESMRFRKNNVGGTFDDDRIEAARLMLKDKGYMVASDRGPDREDGFYERLLAEQKYKDFRIGNMYIQPDGKVIFGEEKIFGNPEKTAPALKHEPEPVRPAVVQQKVKEQQTVPAAKPGYEIVSRFSDGVNNFCIKKEADGTHKLLHHDWDKKSIVNGKATRKAWYTKARFTSFSEIGRDNNYLYLKIQDVSGKTRYVNQYGSDLTNQQLKKLGIGNGRGGPSR